MLESIKKFIPQPILKKIRPLGHGFLAYLAAIWYGHPSRRMIVVGITGTSGKSTTAAMLAHILNSNGLKTGYITTVGFSDGDKQEMNKHGLSMPGRFLLQKQLQKILFNGCSCAVIEATSEGLAQNRHKGIDFDIALFTNLSPAHLDSHGSYANYRQAKGKLFAALKQGKEKILDGIKIQKQIGANLNDPESEFFLTFRARKKFGALEAAGENKFEVNGQEVKVYSYSDVQDQAGRVEFVLKDVLFSLPALGVFNATNAALSSAAAEALGVSLAKSATALMDFHGVPGRMELIPNERGLTAVLDYAPEPAGMLQALQTLNHLKHNDLIHVFGSTGGHRDVGKRFEFGEISARLADVIIITNDDVYDSSPEEIAVNIKEGINRIPKEERKVHEVITILDRGEAIKHAITIAKPGDTVLFTGKGSEQFLVLPGNRRVNWDEKTVIENALGEQG